MFVLTGVGGLVHCPATACEGGAAWLLRSARGAIAWRWLKPAALTQSELHLPVNPATLEPILSAMFTCCFQNATADVAVELEEVSRDAGLKRCSGAERFK